VTAPPLPPEPPADHVYQDAVYVYQTDVDESLLTTELNLEYLILANKVYVLGADHVPAKLTRLDASIVIEWQEKIEGLYLESTAALALYEMIEEMKHAGVTDIWVTSAYRDYEYQQKTFNKHKKVSKCSRGYKQWDDDSKIGLKCCHGSTKWDDDSTEGQKSPARTGL
jgi:hypothetical protein